MKPTWRRKFLEALERGVSVTLAARAANVNVRHCYRVRESDEAFRQSWEDAQEVCIEKVENKLYEMALSGHVVAAIFFLKSARPQKYRETRALMSPKELEASLEREIQGRVEERLTNMRSVN
jgi:hypothetical protein